MSIPYLTPRFRTIVVGETREIVLNLTDTIRSGLTLSGTPTVAEQTTTDLTIAGAALNTGALSDIMGRTVAANMGVTFRVSGHVAGQTYKMLLTVSTTGSETLKRLFLLKSVAAS